MQACTERDIRELKQMLLDTSLRVALVVCHELLDELTDRLIDATNLQWLGLYQQAIYFSRT
jgi:hypothetical protein